MTMRVGPLRINLAGPFMRGAAGCALVLALLPAPTGAQTQAQRTAAREQQQYCANIAASAETLRLERRRRELAELETQVSARLQALEARQNDLRKILDRLDAFERNAGEALVGLYSRMKPEAAAAQLAELDEDVAAALVLQLKTKVSSTILGEMEAARAAALAKKISDMRKSSAGRKP